MFSWQLFVFTGLVTALQVRLLEARLEHVEFILWLLHISNPKDD